VRFRPLDISGAFLLEPEEKKDRHGFFTRGYCRYQLEARGLDPAIVRCDIAITHQRGTVQGLHWQAEPYAAARLLRATRGRAHFVIADLRPESPTFKEHWAVELDDQGRCSLYVPAGVAHGFQTLTDEAEVLAQASEFHHAESCRGARWDDPALAIAWPLPVSQVSEQDRSFPDFDG